MKKTKTHLAGAFLGDVSDSLAKGNLPLILKSLNQLPEDDIWWRPNSASNSAGNLVLHLCGNVRQWIIAGLGGVEFQRDRDREFSEKGPIPRRVLSARLRQTVQEACAVLARLSDDDLFKRFNIHGYHVTGLIAARHVAEHFGYHTGQIIYITKLKRAQDLKYTRLPKLKKPANKARKMTV
ncbi:MAG TPA: DUF1572 family protein [Candidatus Acidoferrales bacterium]|jgi:uncharacterized damage-inducible protein DinB